MINCLYDIFYCQVHIEYVESGLFQHLIILSYNVIVIPLYHVNYCNF